jgi:xylose dehydrogenase (NAD/NADP)
VRLLRWGLLGTARINRLLIPAIRASARSVVHAVASRDRARAIAYAAEWHIPHACPSYAALLASDIDIVYVPLPNALHTEWTLRALAAGKHVLCEKPLALTAADVDTIADAAARHRLVVSEGFMYRHHAQTLSVQRLVADGAIGELRAIAGAFSYPRSRDRDVRLDPALGGGVLWDVGCYPASFAQAIAGAPPIAVCATQQAGPTGVDEQCTGTITYRNGVDAQIFASFRAAYHTAVHLTGTTGAIEIDRPFRPDPVETIRIRRDRDVERVDVRGGAIFVDEVTDMEDAVLGVRPPRISLAESRTLAATLAAMHASARSGRRVAVAADRPQ